MRTREYGGEIIAKLPVTICKDTKTFEADLPEDLGAKEAMYFSIEGKGTFDFISFDLA